ncbi:MAG: oligoendopeptidase F [Candidatus Zixiibacteriota bacterium]
MNSLGLRFNQTRLTMLVAAILLLSHSVLSAPATRVRDSIPEQYRWDLSDIYPNRAAWERAYDSASGMMDSFGSFKGRASKTPKDLATVLEFRDQVGMKVDRVSLFADLNLATAIGDNELTARNQRAENLRSRLAEAASWLEPELLQLSSETVRKWLDREPALTPYRYWLDNLFRMKPHYLDEKGERLLSYFGTFNSSVDAVYSGFVYSDIQYPTYISVSGDTLLLSEGQVWYQMRTNRDQEERRRIFQTFYKAYDSYINTYAAMYNSILQRDWALARARNYELTLEAALDGDNVPGEVYRNLISTVRKGTGPLQKYHQLRKEALDLEHYYWSDRQASLISSDHSYEYDQVVPWMYEAMAPLGDDYARRLGQLFGGRRIDVYENEDKYTGGFQSDAYGTPQYILMNFNGTLEEVFTLAHEAGHAIHANYSGENQPYATVYSTIFVAEVPSTLNEALLLDYMMQRTDSPEDRVAMLQRAIENIEGTFYLQTMFADFEWQAHQLVETGEPVTAESLRGICGQLMSDYYGEAIEVDSLYYSYWTRIGHFFSSPYYVYKYATSFAASAQIVQGIRSSDPETRDKSLDAYLALLKAGGNNYPMAQLKAAGIDMTSPEAIQAVIDQLDTLVNRLEAELARI